MRPHGTVAAELECENGVLVYRTSYDPNLIAALKAAVPAGERHWDNERRVWLVAQRHAQLLVKLTEQYLGINIGIPGGIGQAAQPETKILDVRYIGATKERGDGERSAFGWCDGGWNVVFPESVLQLWFGMDQPQPDAAPTLYGVLGLRKAADEGDIRRAYRRLARQWHPDVCREPNAKEQFIVIQHAYEVLSSSTQRARYDAGLALEATLGMERRLLAVPNDGYRSPLRCGMIMCNGIQSIKFMVSEILAWEDVTDAAGRVLSTSWPLGAQTYKEDWL